VQSLSHKYRQYNVKRLDTKNINIITARISRVVADGGTWRLKGGGKAMANYPKELAQDAVCQSHTGHMTGLWFLPNPAFKDQY